MSKTEVCEYIGKSKRTVDSYTAHGRLRMGYWNGPNGKTAIFQRADVEALKRDLENPTYRAVVPVDQPRAATQPGGLAVVPPAADPQAFALVIAETLRAALPPATPEEPKPWLPLAEAAEFSGLPASYLLTQAKAGKIRAVNVGTGAREFWRFNRAALAK